MSGMPFVRCDSKTAMMPAEKGLSPPGPHLAQSTHPSPALTHQGDDQCQAMEQRVQRLGGALGFVPEHPVHQESCTEREGT